MTSEVCSHVEEQAKNSEDGVVRRGSVFGSVVRGLLWPVNLAVRAYRGFWWVLGFRKPEERVLPHSVSSPARHSLTARKRLHRVTRMLLSILPHWAQGALGFPVFSTIGLSLSPEISASPTKPHGKGSKRKQDDLEDDEEYQTWVEALSQELADEGSEEDPDYVPSSIETGSEEYISHNSTESDLEVPGKGIVIEDVNTDVPSSALAEVSHPDV